MRRIEQFLKTGLIMGMLLAACIVSVTHTAYAAGDFTIDAGGVLTAYHGNGGEVTIPEGVVRIGPAVFQNNEEITAVSIPEGVTAIGMSAFQNCWNLRSVSLPRGLQRIEAKAFAGNASFTELILPDTLTYIGAYAINDCLKLKELDIPASVTEIGECAFAGDLALERVSVPGSVRSLPCDLFSGCESLTEVSLGEGITTLVKWTFSMTPLTSLVLPDSATTLGGQLFYGCGKLASVTVPRAVTSIADSCFDNAGIEAGGLTICGWADSYAEKFAAEHNIPFKALDANKPTAITLETKSVTLGKGEECLLTASLTPGDAETELVWKSSKPKTVSVQDGKLTARKKGSAVVSVTTDNGLTAKISVTVKAAPKTVILNRKGTVKLKKGKTLKLKAAYSNDAASKLTWKSSKKKIAKVSQSGKVTTLKKGTAVITVTTFNGKQAKVKIKVTN